MSRSLSIVLSMFCLMPVFGEVPEIELKTEKITHFEARGGGQEHWLAGRYVYFNGRDPFRVDLVTLRVEPWDIQRDPGRFLGRQNGEYLIGMLIEGGGRSSEEDGFQNIYLYDPETEEKRLLAGIEGGSAYARLYWLYHYYDDYYLGSISEGDDNYMHNYLYNNRTGEKEMQIRDGLLDLSPDRLTGVLFDRDIGLYVRDVGKRETISVVEKYRSRDIRYIEVYYLSNDLFAVKESNDFTVYDVSGSVKAKVKYVAPAGETIRIKVPDIIRYSNFVFWRTWVEEARYFALTKADSIHDHLNDLDLLFTPTTGTCNDSRVRIREWPLLPAKTLGHLETGDEIEILDQSGIKVKIDDMEEYWYKIRRKSDGLEGWSYGAFIDFDE